MTETIQLNDQQQRAIDEFNQRVGELVLSADIAITDQASLTKSGSVKVSLESFIKSVKTFFSPEVDPLEERLKLLKNNRASLTAPAEAALKGLVNRQRLWMADEKSRADAETKRKQDEVNRQQQQRADEDQRLAKAEAMRKRRETVAQINADLKAGLIGKREAAKRLKEAGAEEEAAIQTAAAVAEEEKAKPAPTVRVAPSIPVVQGVRNQTYFKSSVDDKYEFIEAFEKAVIECNEVDIQHLEAATARRDFLRKFIAVNEAEVGKFTRDTKDPDKVMALLPGVRSWSEG